MLWSGLRFGDIQRSHLSTWQLDRSSLRGLTWRSKTSSSATPFGVCTCGILSKGSLTWIHRYLQTLDRLYTGTPAQQIDFALPQFSGGDTPSTPWQAMTYGEALHFLRFYMTLPWSSVTAVLNISSDHYTIHGLKCTLLSWACQLGLSEEDRRQHGKHKPAQQSVALYSRDDVVGSLRLQNQIVSHVCKGWIPCTPLARGGQRPIQEPPFKLEQFRKDLPDLVWKFFRFDMLPTFHSDVVSASATGFDDADDAAASDSSSSDSSRDSSVSSSGDEAVQHPVVKKQRNDHQMMNHSDQAFGLHRHTWHIMLPVTGAHADAPSWDDKQWRTACGRFFPAANLCISSEFLITEKQSICSHAGCNKFFTRMDA